MPVTLNDIIDLHADYQPTIDFGLVEAYGNRMGACINAEISINRQTEYVIQYAGKRCIVYNWEQSGGDSRMYIKDQWGTKLFLTEDAVNMLTYGNPEYSHMKLVAQSLQLV